MCTFHSGSPYESRITLIPGGCRLVSLASCDLIPACVCVCVCTCAHTCYVCVVCVCVCVCVLCVCAVCASSASAHVWVCVVCVVHARVRVRLCACVMGEWAGMMGAGRYRACRHNESAGMEMRRNTGEDGQQDCANILIKAFLKILAFLKMMHWHWHMQACIVTYCMGQHLAS